MSTYTLDPNLSTEDAMLVAAAKNARDAARRASRIQTLLRRRGTNATGRKVLDKARNLRDNAEHAEMVLADLAGYADGYPEHVIAAIEAD